MLWPAKLCTSISAGYLHDLSIISGDDLLGVRWLSSHWSLGIIWGCLVHWASGYMAWQLFFRITRQVCSFGMLRVTVSWFSSMWKQHSCSHQTSRDQKYLWVSMSRGDVLAMIPPAEGTTSVCGREERARQVYSNHFLRRWHELHV